MIWLALSVLSMLYLALLVRWGEIRGQDRLATMAWNYLVAGGISAALAALSPHDAPAGATVALGILTGITYAASLLLWMVAVTPVGLGVSTVAMRISVVWPVLVSIAAFGEIPSRWEAAGIVLAVAAIALVARASGAGLRRLNRDHLLLLLLLWAVSGSNGVLMKVFSETQPPGLRSVFLAIVFASAGLLCWTGVALRGARLRTGDALGGALFGLGNVAGNGFLLLALQDVPAVITFPIRDAAVIAVVSLAGIALFRERPGPWGYAAMAAAAGAVALMSA
jgi:drug/metabolite transporter (DMT)-like permease